MNRKSILLIAAAGCMLGLSGCKLGQVEQGWAVAFDEASKTVTVVHEPRENESMKPIAYRCPKCGEVSEAVNLKPPAAFKLPDKPEETGPLPKAGRLLNVDAANKRIAIYDEPKKALAFVPIEIVSLDDKVDKNALKDRKFPEIKDGTVTIYANKALITFKPAGDYAGYPPETWVAGDLVRIYFKQEGQALRFMNVTQTNIYKR